MSNNAAVPPASDAAREPSIAPPVAPAPGPMSGIPLVVGTIALSLATFMNVLDTSIANVSIPAISGDLGVSVNQGTWVITSFAVSMGIGLPLTGWLAQRFGAVRLFTLSILMFVLMSWLCGLAPSVQTLIACRVLQGAVAGPMIPLSQSILLASYPKEQSGMALAMWSITTLIAPVVGPVLGGWITDYYSWPWIFYINIPVGMIAAAVTWLLYRHRETPIRKLPIDGVGLALLVIWVGSLQVMFDKGKELDWFASWEIIALAVAAMVGFCFFLVWELGEEHPIVDLTLFKRRNFWTATMTISLGYFAFFGNLVLLPLWLQQYMGYTATLAGFAMAPVGIAAILLSPWVGKNVARIDPRRFATVGFLIFAFVLVLRSHFNTQADFLTILWPTLIQGAAMALFFVPLFNLALSGIPPQKIAAASGLLNFARITAGAFGASVMTTLWDRRAAMHHADLAERIDPTNTAAMDAVNALHAAAWSGDQTRVQLSRLIDEQAYMLSANDLFIGCAALFILLIGVVWIAQPERIAAPVADAGGH